MGQIDVLWPARGRRMIFLFSCGLEAEGLRQASSSHPHRKKESRSVENKTVLFDAGNQILCKCMLSCSETLPPPSSLSISITESADGYSGKGLFVHAYYRQDLMATVVLWPKHSLLYIEVRMGR